MEACFAISPVETQHVRLFFEHDDVKLGVAEVRFVELRAIALEEADNCLTLRGTLGPTPSAYSYIFEADPTGAPTSALTLDPTGAPTTSVTEAPTTSVTSPPTLDLPTAAPTGAPTSALTLDPTGAPTTSVTEAPTTSVTSP